MGRNHRFAMGPFDNVETHGKWMVFSLNCSCSHEIGSKLANLPLMAVVADLCANFFTSIAKELVCGAKHEASYCWYFNTFVEELEFEKYELLKYKERVNDHAESEKRKRAKKIDEDSKDWLEKADALLDQVKRLKAKVEKYKNCRLVCCPNCICRYIVGRQLVKLKDNVKQHCDKRPRFKEMDRLLTLPGMEYFSSENFMKFESRESAREQLMEAIKRDGVSMIGLHGMGGSGKTTLAKEVGKEAERLLHYKVAFAVVSRNEVRSIQNKIASWIGFEFPAGKEEIERAKRLKTTLSDGHEKFLIILDDVWETLDFEAIGIPFGENCKGCKVLITTRSLAVCNLMNCQKSIRLLLLSSEESLALFQKHADITDDLKDLAKEITQKCDGLPVAIAAVASTLKGKPQVTWEVALQTLKESRPMDIDVSLQNPYTCLQLSYENLKCQEAKSLFLLCSAFPEDEDIPVEMLARFAIGLGLFGNFSSYTMARKQVIAAKHELINACLLLEAEDDENNSVKMHDLVRDVALYVAKGKIKEIKGNDSNENALEEDLRILNDKRVRYLWCDKFPNQLSCSKLEFFCVYRDSEIVEVPNGVFENLKKLLVLVLNSAAYIEKFPQLPKSIEKLTNLRCLFLENCELGNISFLQSMKGLESLTLVSCTFLEFPEAIVHLTKLKLLHVTGCEIERSPYEVIGRCSQLQELYFAKNDCPEWSYADETAAKFLENFNAPQALQRYQIEIGDGEERNDIFDGCILNILVIQYFVASIPNSIIKDLVKKAEILSLGHIQGDCKSIVPGICQKVGGGMSELIELMLHDSEEIKYLIDNIERQCKAETVFSKLSKLRIEKMHRLEALCHGLPPPVLFEKLEEIYICKCSQLNGVLFIGKLNLCKLQVLELEDCPRLTSIFTDDSVQSLSQLQYLKIYRCSELNHIITEEVKEEINEEDNDHRTNQLHFQKLKRIIVWSCIQLKYTIPVSYARGLVQLESMEIAEVDELKFLFGQYSHANQLADAAENDFQVKLPVLKLLQLSGLPNIVGIFPENYYPVWPSLHELHLNNCPQFSIMSLNKCVVGSEVKQHCGPTKDLIEQSYKSLVKPEINWLERIKSVFSACSMKSMPQLEELRIEGCDQLEQIIASEEHHNIMNSGTESCPKSTSNCCTLHPGSLGLCTLKLVYLTECPMLKSLFTLSIARSLTSLESLTVSNCHGLKEIIQNDGDLQSHDSVFPKLKDLDIRNCNSLECIFLVSFTRGLMELERISIFDAPQLQYLFGEGSLEHHSSHQYQNIIRFELPVLENLTLEKLPNLISICPNNYHAVCSSLQNITLDHVGLSNSTTNNSKGGSEDRHWGCTSAKDLNELSYESLVKLKINGLERIKSVFSACSMKSMPQLEELSIVGCDQLEQIVVSEEHHNIMNSGTESCPKSTSNCYTLHPGSLDLCTLKLVYLTECPMLKSLFTLSIARSLTSLESLTVSNCHGLKEIIQNDGDLQSHDSVFPKLKDLDIRNCNSLECIFLVSFTRGFMELERISIFDAPQLQYLFGEGSLEHHSSHQYQNIIRFELPVLEDLTLEKLPNLISICPNNYHAVCSSLQNITLDHVGLSNSTTNNSKGGSEDRHWGCTSAKDLNELSYESLVKLEINGLERIKSVFSACSMKSMPQLEELSIVGCDQLEQIVVSEEHHNIMNSGTESCPKSTSNCCTLHPGSLDLCTLKLVYLTECPMLKSLFTLSIARSLTSLESLTVSNCHGLKEIIQNDGDLQSHDSVFPKLKDLDIRNCNSLECIFLVSFTRGFMELERISIFDAPQLQYLFGEGSLEHHSSHQYQNIIRFELPVLEDLTLEKLPNLISICPNNYHAVCSSLQNITLDHVGLSNSTTNNSKGGSEDRHWGCTSAKDLNELSYESLVKLEINGLERIKSVFSACSMKSMPQLEELSIVGCDQLEQIVVSEEHHNIMNSGTESCPKSTSNCCTLHPGSLDLCTLKLVYLTECPMLKSLFTLSIARSLTSLESLTVSNCHGLKEIIQNDGDLQSHDSVFPKLKDLDIRNCNSLECIFLVSFTRGFMELERISIFDAPQLQYLFGEGSLEHHSSHQYQNIIRFELPVLEDLTLEKLPNLISICPNNYHAVCSSLQNITLDHVGLSNSTTNNSKGGSEDRHWGCTSAKDLNELSYESLVKPEINWLERIKSVFSACSMKSMPQLEKLRIEGCDQLEQIIASEEHHNIMNSGTESCPKSTSNCCTLHPGSLDLCTLKLVYLAECPMLKSLFTLSIARSLTSLERLKVSNCHGLKEIIQNDGDLQSHDSVFPKLKDLDIRNCNSLECIFLVSFTRGLMELERISIFDAPQLQYLFGEGSLEHHSSHQYQNIIRFELPVLENLTLEKLPNLISICPNNYHAVCSSLQNITLDHVGLSNSTTNNSKGGSEDRHWGCTSAKDLRATIMKLVQNSEEHIIRKENDLLLLREMELQYQHEIMYLCISPKRFLNLQNLLELRVKGCGKLKAMFSVSVLRSLPQLKALLMIECEELEQITIEDEENENLSNPYSQKGCFPQLKVLIIKCCNKLKRLFSISTSREFPKLEYLIIKEASQLEEVFESEKCETEERKVVLSELKYLFLVQLPILTHVWQGIQTVTYRVVQNCPKLFLTIAPQKSFIEFLGEIQGNLYYHHKDLSRHLRGNLMTIIEETYNEDPMLKSEVSDFEDEAASGSEPPSSQIIEQKGKEIVGKGSVSKAPAMATSSIDVHELMDEQSINEPTLLGQHLALGEPKLTTKVPQEIISSYQSVEAIPHETAKKSPTSKEALVTTLSDDIALPIGPLPKVSAQEPMNERSETIMTNQQDFGEMTSYTHSNASHNGVSEEVQEDRPIKKADTMTSLTDLEPGSFTSLHKSSPQDTEVVVKESSQEGPSFEKATIATLSNDLAPRNSLPAGSLAIGPPQKASHLRVVDGIHEGLPREKAKTVASSSKIILTEQQATEGNEITNNSVNSLLDPGQNEPKLKISSLCPPIALSDKTFSQISSNSAISPSSSTSAILLAELCTKSGIDKFSASTEFLGSRLILEPGSLQELKTKLTQSFNMPLEAVFETNTLDDVESIVNSLAMGTTDVIQKNILEDLKSRLKQFKECVPKAISTMQSSLDFMSNYESQNVELNTKLSKGQEKLRDLECKISETRAKEYAVDMKIQQLFAQKMEILEQRKSLASQRNESTEAVSKDYVKWEALRKKLKVSTENWLKSKEDLAHANATWKLFKESLGL